MADLSGRAADAKLGNREGQVRYLRAGLIAAACLALPSTALAAITTAPNGHRLSVMLRNGIKGGPTGKGHGGTTAAVLLSHGGPVLQGEVPYLIYWTPSGYPIASSSENLLNQYLSDATAASNAGATNNVYSVLAQYNAPYDQAFTTADAIPDSNPYPTATTGCTIAPGMAACVTDSEIQAEISKLIATNTIPQPSTPNGMGMTQIYFVITPVNVNVCTGGNVCSSNDFCAYHSYFSNGGQDVLYASVPFSVFANGNTKGCQTDQYKNYETPAGPFAGDEAYNVADDLSHEFSETATDPLINAWYSKQGLEVGDLCEAYASTANTNKGLSPLAYAPAYGDSTAGTLYDQVINGDEYYNQTEYSNAAGGCQAGITPL